MSGAGTDAGARVVAVVGPTATGKSDLALQLAHELDGEIVSADAMQLYRGMDIGTAKLTLSERQGVPHHLLDVIEITDEASLAAYQRAARVAIDQIQARGRTAIVAGGSGLYVRAALDALDIPPTDQAVRERYELRLAAIGASALHAELAVMDPVAAEAILPSNGRRIVRALEVIELTGAPYAASLPTPAYIGPTVQIGLAMPRDQLDRRTDARVEAMWDKGFVAEVEDLAARGLRTGRTASRAVGYAQILRALEGRLTMEQARLETARATRRLIRRQESWLRRDPRITWLDAAASDLLARSMQVDRG